MFFAKNAGLPVVPKVDLTRYAGKWYEIARLPNRFQKKCAGDVTAVYTPQPDGKIKVVNTCKKSDGSLTTTEGTARKASADGPDAKLKVTFFWPFSGDYWIIGLSPDYRWAIVGAPNREYLWFLSRTPSLDAATYKKLSEQARNLGFNTGGLQKTPQAR